MSSYISGVPDPALTAREPVAPIKEAITSDVEFIERRDVLGGNTVIQEYAQVQQWRAHTSYQATASIPMLELPNPEEHSGPSPFEPSWQKATRNFFRNRVREMVLQKIKESGKPVPSESQIQEQINAILKAHVEGKPLSNTDQKIIEKVTKETQEVHQLPSSWHFATQNISDWTPITTDVVPPANIDVVRNEMLCENLERLLTFCEEAAKKIGLVLTPEDPNQAALKDFYLTITRALRELKAILAEFQRVDADTADKSSKAKIDEVHVRDKIIEEFHKKTEEILEARKKQEGQAKVMKIVSPVLSTLVTVLGAASMIVTGGLSSPLVIAGLAVSTSLVAYTIADTELNLTSQVMEAIKPFLESTGAKVIFFSALVVVLAIAIAASGGTAVKIATMTTSEAVKQTMKEVTKQLTIHFATIAIMSSNVLPELIVEALLKSGVINEQDEEGKMIAQIIIMSVIMLSFLMVAAKARGPSKAGGAPKTSDGWIKQLKDWGKGFKDSFSVAAMKKDPSRVILLAQDLIKGGQLGAEIWNGVVVGAAGKELSRLYREQGELEKSQEIIQALIQLLTALLNSAQQSLSQQGEWIKSVDRAFDALDASIRQDMRAGQFAA